MNLFFNRILSLILLSMALLSQTNASYAEDWQSGSIIVNLKDSKQLLKSQRARWFKICGKFASNFKIGQGFWQTGIATKSLCNLDTTLAKEMVKTKLELEKFKKAALAIKQFDSTAKYQLDISIKGKPPKKRLNTGSIIGKPLEFWDGVKRQIFNQEISDKRKITFELKYRAAKGPITLARRTYKYNDRFLNYFDLNGFTDLLAFDLLVEAPFQWSISVLSKQKFTMALKSKEYMAIEISNSLADIVTNKNFVFIRPNIMGNLLYLASSDPIKVKDTRVLSLDIANVNVTRRYVVFPAKPSYDEKDNIFIGLGHERYTRISAHRKFEYLLRKLNKLDLTFFLWKQQFRNITNSFD